MTRKMCWRMRSSYAGIDSFAMGIEGLRKGDGCASDSVSGRARLCVSVLTVGVDLPLEALGVILLKGFGVEEEEDGAGILVMLILGFERGVEAADTGVEDVDELAAASAGFSFFGADVPPSFASRCARIWSRRVRYCRLPHNHAVREIATLGSLPGPSSPCLEPPASPGHLKEGVDRYP